MNKNDFKASIYIVCKMAALAVEQKIRDFLAHAALNMVYVILFSFGFKYNILVLFFLAYIFLESYIENRGVNRIQAMAPILEPPFWGAYYRGTYLPQNRVHSPHLEGER